MKLSVLATTLVLSLTLAGCNQGTAAPKAKDTQAKKAAAAAESIRFSGNAEIKNIKERLELTSDPGLTGFVLLMNEAGQPIMYTGVQGKITSGGKRLTPPVKPHRVDCGRYCDESLGPAPSDEGTWGGSSPYIFFWTTSGQYIQWNGKYLYSDKPFRTSVKPLVVEIK